MVSLSTWFRYMANKFEYSVYLSWKSYKGGHITDTEVGEAIWKNLLHGKLTYLHWNKGQEMAPTIAEQGGTLLVRKLPVANPMHVFVGDVVIMKDPEKSDNHLVRRLAAVEGYEMASTDEKDEPFILEKDQCWVLADNENLKPKGVITLDVDSPRALVDMYLLTPKGHLFFNEVAKDSRIFGPVPMTDIVGRVIYYLRTAVDHGPVQNSHFGMRKDSPVLEVELDVDEMAKNHKA